MGYLNVLTAENIVEGFVASISIVLSYYVLRNYYKLSKPLATMGGWFITWGLRKFSVNTYTYFNQKHGFEIQPLRIDI
tara:strand:- start:568 stop:801 length:234 start_codon:yes stop_codon:yes gene_type:complete